MPKLLLILFSVLLYVFLLICRINYFPERKLQIKGSFLQEMIDREPVIKGDKQVIKIKDITIFTKRYPEYHYGGIIRINYPSINQKNLFYPKIIKIEDSRGSVILKKYFYCAKRRRIYLKYFCWIGKRVYYPVLCWVYKVI